MTPPSQSEEQRRGTGTLNHQETLTLLATISIRTVRQTGATSVHAWAFEGDCDPSTVRSNTFTMEWPPRSGRQMEFPEIDRAKFFDLNTAREKIKAGQEGFLEELETLISSKGQDGPQ